MSKAPDSHGRIGREQIIRAATDPSAVISSWGYQKQIVAAARLIAKETRTKIIPIAAGYTGPLRRPVTGDATSERD